MLRPPPRSTPTVTLFPYTTPFRSELFKDGKTILGLALGLVVFTVVGMGLFIHSLVPAMPLAVAFALAAVVSPTDPIAVSAIAQRSEEHTSELQSLMRISYAVFCLKKKKITKVTQNGKFIL